MKTPEEIAVEIVEKFRDRCQPTEMISAMAAAIQAERDRPVYLPCERPLEEGLELSSYKIRQGWNNCLVWIRSANSDTRFE